MLLVVTNIAAECHNKLEMRLFRILAAAIFIGLFCSGFACAQDAGPPGHVYVTVDNRKFGSVEIVLPNGKAPVLIGRVVTPADDAARLTASSDTPSVLDAGPYGILVSLGDRHGLRILPYLSSIKSLAGSVVLNLGPNKLFPTGLNVEKGALLYRLVGKRFVNVHRGFVPALGDVIALPITVKSGDAELVDLVNLGTSYAQQMLWNAVHDHTVVASGQLTVNPHLSPDEPDRVFAVMLSMDGQLSDLTNRAPFTLNLDTRTIADGEHSMTVSAMDQKGHTITSANQLTMVYNHAFGPPVPKAQQNSPLNR